MITAGPTYEAIDAVRFIGNYSSGKMGYTIADAFAREGGKVLLISGPVSLKATHPSISTIYVESADEMYREAVTRFPKSDIAVLSAAVSDFSPESPQNYKVKRGKEDWKINLKPTRDIAAKLGEMKTSGQFIAGFALETDNEIENAQKKLKQKNFDIIVLNSLKDKGAGFGVDTNRIRIIDKNNNIDTFELKSKRDVALDIVAKIASEIEG